MSDELCESCPGRPFDAAWCPLAAPPCASPVKCEACPLRDSEMPCARHTRDQPDLCRGMEKHPEKFRPLIVRLSEDDHAAGITKPPPKAPTKPLDRDPPPSPRVLIRAPHLDPTTGYGRIAIETATAISRAGVPVAIEPLGRTGVRSGLPAEARHLIDAPGQPDLWCVQLAYPGEPPPAGRRTVAWTMHEIEGLTPDEVRALNATAAVVVPCEFNRRTFEAAGVVRPIHVIPFGVDPAVFHPGDDWAPEHRRVGRVPRFGLAGQAGGEGHCGHRKMIREGIEAFLRAFPDDAPYPPNLEVKLTPKCKVNLPRHPRVRIIREAWSPGEMADWLRALDVYLCPSAGEGFGLITLQAMACGVPVVFAANTSTVDFCDDSTGWPVECRREPAGACYKGRGDWFPPDWDRFVEAIREADRDDQGRWRKAQAAADRAREYTWDRTARGLVEALRGAVALATPGLRNGRALRPRLVMSAPWDARPNGVVDYAVRLAAALRPFADVTLARAPALSDEPIPEWLAGFEVVSAESVDPGRFDAAIHHLGNSGGHAWQPEFVERVPGVVTFHDLHLDYLGEVMGTTPERLVHRLALAATRIAVHARYNLGQLPEALRDKAEVVPFGAEAVTIDEPTRREIRLRAGLPPDAYLLGMGGWLMPNKLVLEALMAFSIALGRAWIPESSRFVLVGPDPSGWAAWGRDAIRPNCVIMLGEIEDEAFGEILGSLDVGLCLRRPPTRGETSAALFDLMRHGVPTIASNAGSWAEVHDGVVLKVDYEDTFGPDGSGLEGLAVAMKTLSADRAFARRIGDRARARCLAHHSWPIAARRYAKLCGLPCGCGGHSGNRATIDTRTTDEPAARSDCQDRGPLHQSVSGA